MSKHRGCLTGLNPALATPGVESASSLEQTPDPEHLGRHGSMLHDGWGLSFLAAIPVHVDLYETLFSECELGQREQDYLDGLDETQVARLLDLPDLNRALARRVWRAIQECRSRSKQVLPTGPRGSTSFCSGGNPHDHCELGSCRGISEHSPPIQLCCACQGSSESCEPTSKRLLQKGAGIEQSKPRSSSHAYLPPPCAHPSAGTSS